MKTLAALVILVILFVPTLAPAFKTIRDGSGNLIGTETRINRDRIEIRDKDNNLVGQTNREGSRTIFRDGDGNQIGEIDRGDD